MQMVFMSYLSSNNVKTPAWDLDICSSSCRNISKAKK